MIKKILILFIYGASLMAQSYVSNLPELPRATEGTDVMLIEDVSKTYKITFDSLKSAIRPYKSYVALVTQSGTNDPIVTVVHNEIGAIVWTRLLPGIYLGNLIGAFPNIKTVGFYGGAFGVPVLLRSSDDIFRIEAKNYSGVNSDGVLYETSIEIRVYE